MTKDPVSTNHNENQEPKKKLTFAEAMKEKLASKANQHGGKAPNSTKVNALRSQQNKKQNNQRRRTGV